MGILGDDSEKLHRKLSGFSDAVVASFNNVKRDITLQNQWISHLNTTHKDLLNRHDTHRNLTSAELGRLKSWIMHLHDSSQRQEKDLEELKKRVAEAFNTYNRHITDLYKIAQKEQVDVNKLKHEVKNDIMPELHRLMEGHNSHSERLFNDSKAHAERLVTAERAHADQLARTQGTLTGKLFDEHKTHTERLVNEHKAHTERLVNEHKAHTERLVSEKIEAIPAVKEIQMVPKPSLLTYPEQKLLNLLLNEADPITYEQCAHKTGHSINTVRVIMNSLKKRNLIEEHLLPSGIKLFNARNKERIKKIYNLDYL